MTGIHWVIPPSMLENLAELPTDRPVAMLIRHSVRDCLPAGEGGYSLPITPVGERLARKLGAVLGARLRSLRASPLVRTVQTGEELVRGAGLDLTIIRDRHLGDPGLYVLDDDLAQESFQAYDYEFFMDHLVGADEPLPGLAPAEPAARYLVHHMLAAGAGVPGIHAFVTHDSLVTATAARLLDHRLKREDWPWYLEAAFFWESGTGIEARYRSLRRLRPGPLCTLGDGDVLEFARREIAMTVGLDFPARFFLSGGAFKSLLTGHPPQDLDLWAPSPEDRVALVARLDQQKQRARRLPRRAYSEAWEIAGRVVEVPDKAEPDTLEARHARYDVALSAVGVEHLGGRGWRPLVHPLARASAERREVLLLKPLANPRYALTTLERLRRYATELDYRIPPNEEALLWRVFEQADAAEKRELVERFERTARHDQGVGEEVAHRLR